MHTVYLLINVETGEEDAVMRGLKSVFEVKEAHKIYGVYDIIARLEAEIMQDIRDAVILGIRKLDHVRSTMTIFIVD